MPSESSESMSIAAKTLDCGRAATGNSSVRCLGRTCEVTGLESVDDMS
jgi:hypothetical protein